MHHLFVRSTAMFLAFFLCFTALPLPTLAETEETPTEATTEAATEPTTEPATEPTTESTTEPTTEPSTEPTTGPTTAPVIEPTTEPTTAPTTEPTVEEPTLPPETQPETIAPVTMDPIGGHLPEGTPVTLSCATEGASIYYALSYDGETYSEYYQYTQPLLPEADFSYFCVKAYAVKMGLPDGPVTEAIFTGTPKQRQSEDGWHLYFGQLHHHSTVSGTREDQLSPEETYIQASQTENMDFFAITDHSHSFDGTPSADLTIPGAGTEWLSGKAAAAAITTGDFVGLWGYELSWQDDLYFGHISTFATEGFASRSQSEFSNFASGLENYYAALAACPGAIGQFSHPSMEYSFQNFSHYSPQADAAMSLLELPDTMDCQYYHKALLSGWHVAPTFGGTTPLTSADPGRTVVLASTLTEASLYEALRNRRAYATTDSDLMVDFRLNGAVMGSILNSADAANITLSLSDPTDTGTATVTVITDTQTVTETLDLATGQPLTFQLPATDEFYYIQVLQSDGDMAVTAPIWIQQPEDMGISGLSCDTVLPVRGHPVNITLELYNNETIAFTAETIEFYTNDALIKSMPAMTISPGRAESCTFSYTHDRLGVTPIRAVVTTTINGENHQFSQELPLRYHLPEQITSILVDGFYSDISDANLQNLTALAAKSDITVKTCPQELTVEDLQNTGLVILPAPKSPYSDTFAQNLSEYTKNGGNLILWGQSSTLDTGFDSAAEINRLLSHLGATLRLLPGTVTDEEHNGGAKDLLYPTVFNETSPWCDQIDNDQIYTHRSGCAVDPGQGEWLVKGFSTTYWGETAEPVLSARESTASGGTILLAGSPFLKDTDMPLPKNDWDPPRINQSLLMKLLKIEETRVELPISTIHSARNGSPGEVYRIQGYVTAGTSNPYNTFPGTIYLQDETGGIAVVPYTEKGVQIGTPMEIIGYLDEIQGNPVLQLIDDTPLEGKDKHRFDPRTIPNKEAMDYDLHGGELLQIEGNAISITYTANQKGVTRLTLKDQNGDLATVLIESYIGAGSSGENNLAEKVRKGKTVRIRGILHLDNTGTPVLRVRNCEEVIYVPPIVTPNTGDQVHTSLTILALSALGLVLLFLVRKKP